MFTDQPIATVDHTHTFPITLAAHQGMSLLIDLPASKADRTESRPSGDSRLSR